MLYHKYDVVQRITKEETRSVDVADENSSFVLMPRKDPTAMVALEYYADFCEPEMGKEIKRWIQLIKQAPKILGTQGKRNKPFCKVV